MSVDIRIVRWITAISLLVGAWFICSGMGVALWLSLLVSFAVPSLVMTLPIPVDYEVIPHNRRDDYGSDLGRALLTWLVMNLILYAFLRIHEYAGESGFPLMLAILWALLLGYGFAGFMYSWRWPQYVWTFVLMLLSCGVITFIQMLTYDKTVVDIYSIVLGTFAAALFFSDLVSAAMDEESDRTLVGANSNGLTSYALVA